MEWPDSTLSKIEFLLLQGLGQWLLFRPQWVPVTHLADGAHGSHVALIAGAELGGCQQPCWVQAVQAPVDGDFTHCSQVTVAPDLKLR